MIRERLYPRGFSYPAVAPLPFDGFGWRSDAQVFADVIRETQPTLILEVGTWLGASARHMARLAPQAHIVAIDTFLGSEWHWLRPEYVDMRETVYPQFISNVIHEKLTTQITPLPLDSVNAYHVLRHLGAVADLIYIDGGHTFESVSMDIECYRRLLRPGGIMLLDDAQIDSVRRAAEARLGRCETQNEKLIWSAS